MKWSSENPFGIYPILQISQIITILRELPGQPAHSMTAACLGRAHLRQLQSCFVIDGTRPIGKAGVTRIQSMRLRIV